MCAGEKAWTNRLSNESMASGYVLSIHSRHRPTIQQQTAVEESVVLGERDSSLNILKRTTTNDLSKEKVWEIAHVPFFRHLLPKNSTAALLSLHAYQIWIS